MQKAWPRGRPTRGACCCALRPACPSHQLRARYATMRRLRPVSQRPRCALTARRATMPRLIILPHAVFWDHAGAIRDAVKPVHNNVFVGELRPENSFEPASAARKDISCCGGGRGAECEGGRGSSHPSAGSCSANSCGEQAGCGTVGREQTQPRACGRVDKGEHASLRMGNYVVPGARPSGGAAGGAEEEDVPTVVVYIGEEGPELTRLMLENASFRFLLFSAKGSDGGGGMVSEDALVDSARALKRRYYLMMKTKDAERVGIVVATTAVQGYGAMVQRLKTIIRAAGKRPYVFYVGKLNPAKLANFPEMDALVLVASPETCAGIDTGEYWKPLITPMECEMALVKGRTWTGQYNFDFRPLLATALPEAPLRLGKGGDSDDEEEISHSLTAGTLAVRSAGAVMAVSAGEVMMTTRTFKGLDLSEGLDHSLDLVQGRVGIASGYSHEPSATSNQLHHTSVTDGTTVPLHMQGHASAVNYVVAGTANGSSDLFSLPPQACDSAPVRANADAAQRSGERRGTGQDGESSGCQLEEALGNHVIFGSYPGGVPAPYGAGVHPLAPVGSFPSVGEDRRAWPLDAARSTAGTPECVE